MMSANSKCGRKTWEGIEDFRENIRRIAHIVVESDAEVRRQYPSSVATGLICEAMRSSSRAPTPEVATAAHAQNMLYELTNDLVNVYGMDIDVILAEYAPILDPKH